MTEPLEEGLELWGGLECTVNRVRDEYSDQIERCGHAARPEDLERIAALGVRTIRYPVLWERVAPESLDRPDWEWSDRRMERLRALGIRPIVGLLHHGSGPRYTHLLDPEFPTKFARYARLVAERYPWATDYTPINEPLTTARFSALYGLWYPHARNDRSFARAVFHQCRATALAMRAIREVQPAAKLIQTEDLGTIDSTPRIRYQADFENHRRWLTWDILCGYVHSRHPLRRYLRRFGIAECELESFRRQPCPPDRIGINHYVTSHRFLDHRIGLYPTCFHGGNGRHRYADIEAVRVQRARVPALRDLLATAWQRYGIPLAITEAHIGCTREEQVRWLCDVWREAEAARAAGVGIEAVTVWSLLGSFDWDSLVTRRRDHYEPGLFDVRSPSPRPTALAWAASALARGEAPSHPILESPGWWRRDDRFLVEESRRSVTEAPPGTSRPILIAGGSGTLAHAFARRCEARGLPYLLTTRRRLDIADPRSVRAALDELRPWAVINAAGYVRVDDAENEPERCFRENTLGPATLAAACAERGIRLVSFSSDLVFDGKLTLPYVESSLVSPLNVYGISKARAEERILSAFPEALVVRTSAFFGPWDAYNFVTLALQSLESRRPVRAAGDCVVSPTYVPELVDTTLDLLIDRERGIWHLANRGAVSWAELARLVAAAHGYHPSLVEECPASDFGYRATRPAYSALSSERSPLLGCLERALGHYLDERRRSDWKRKEVAQ